RLEEQLHLAIVLKKPVVIHSRDAEEDLLLLLTHYAKRVSTGVIPGMIHCFSGTRTFGQACLDLGFYISFSGIITFKNAESLRECAREFPLDRILVETDSPYLAPIPHRGKKCEPSMVRLTANKLAEVRGITFETVAEATTANAKRFFKI
ncbi:MAG: TatD family hydrolase, partial [Bdellovibrionota bacterium]